MTLRQIHSLYLLLKPYLPKQDYELLIDQAKHILKRSAPGTLEESFKIMYGKPLKLNPIQAATYFMKGLKETEFFAYIEFLKQLNGR